MAHDFKLSDYLGKKEIYKFFNWYYFWPKIIDLVKCFISAYYSYKCTKAFNIKY
jgi:hypothetical protein